MNLKLTFTTCIQYKLCSLNLVCFCPLFHQLRYVTTRSEKKLTQKIDAWVCFYFMKQADVYYFEAIKITSKAWSKLTENTCLVARILHTKFD